MANKLQDLLSLQARKGCRVTATAFALAVTGAWQLAPLPAQDVEVEVFTSGTQTQENPSSVNVKPEDLKADEAANKIVPAPGTHLQSTVDSTLGGSGAVAAAPSVSLNADQLVLKEGETTETVAVRSGAELLRMLGIQNKSAKTASTGGELDEESTSNTLFDVSAVERLKGEKPTVVYRVVVENDPLPDPMIVPWIRQAKLLQERFDKAVAMLGDNQVERGRQELLAIATDFPDSDYAIQSRELLKKLDDIKTQMVQPIVRDSETPAVELSPNIQVGTVIVDAADVTGNRVMVNGRIYKAGEDIRGVPGHKIVGISENVVQIEVEQSGQKQIFDVPVRPTGANQ